jgi:hypothetical protein
MRKRREGTRGVNRIKEIEIGMRDGDTEVKILVEFQ